MLVDGRSVYSSFFLGDTHRGLMTVMPEDIERIEVLRGANSAAYGANAMFGVINIITRHSFDGQGTEVAVNAGSGGVRDARFSVGWGQDQASYRLSAGSRADNGYAYAFDDRQLQVLDWRADFRPSTDDDLMLKAGTSEIRSGSGRADLEGNPLRTVQWHEWYLQGRWQRQLSVDSQLQITADFSDEAYTDVSRYVLDPRILLDYSSRARRMNLELQHKTSLREGLRAVWGLGWKEEQADSWPLYTTTDPVGYHESRAFGHLEWRPTEHWTANAGVFVGQHSLVGAYATPRLMLNYHFTPDHTLRFGSNRSVRTNSLLEVLGDVRFYQSNGKQRLIANLGNPDIRPEVLNSLEVSYLGNFRPWHLTLDVRAYNEHVQDWVNIVDDPKTKYPRVFRNVGEFTVRGIEYQMVWSPREGSRLQWQQNFSQLDWTDPSRASEHQPPARASTLAWFQRLPRGLDLTLMWFERGAMTWNGDKNLLPPAKRLDLRLAHPWRIGSTRAETALTLQALNGDQVEGYQDYLFKRRAFLTLKLEH